MVDVEVRLLNGLFSFLFVVFVGFGFLTHPKQLRATHPFATTRGAL
jgi:hypothetical protein